MIAKFSVRQGNTGYRPKPIGNGNLKLGLVNFYSKRLTLSRINYFSREQTPANALSSRRSSSWNSVCNS